MRTIIAFVQLIRRVVPRTVADTGGSLYNPRLCDWDRASNVEPFTSLYITSEYALLRLNVNTGQLSNVNCGIDINPFGIVCLSNSGKIVVSCLKTHGLWTIDRRVCNHMDRLAGVMPEPLVLRSQRGTIRFRSLLLHRRALRHERDQSILVADWSAHVVLRVPLPDRLFLQS
jgi:hypothetical protein